MKLLLISSGANTSIKDMDRGYADAFRRAGVDVLVYDLERRMNAAAVYLHTLWEAYDKRPEAPTLADTLYDASFRALERALRHDVDAVLLIGGMFFHPDALTLFGRAGLPLYGILTESPYDDQEQASILPFFEAVWTNERTSVYYLSRFCQRTYYLPHAYDPARHFVAPGRWDVPAYDVVFVGTAFPERVELLRAVHWGGSRDGAKPITFGLYGAPWETVGDYWLGLHVRDHEVENAAAVELYRRARVGLNLYRQRSIRADRPASLVYAESLNPRALELAACGVVTVSEYRPEVEEVFGPWVPTFRHAAELEPLIRKTLADTDFRRTAARVLPDLVRDRTFDANVRRILAEMQRVPGVVLDADAVDLLPDLGRDKLRPVAPGSNGERST